MISPIRRRWALSQFLCSSTWSAGTTWSNLLSVARDAASSLEGTEAHREALGLMERARRLKDGE